MKTRLVVLFTLAFLLATMFGRHVIAHQPGECWVQHQQVRCAPLATP